MLEDAPTAGDDASLLGGAHAGDGSIRPVPPGDASSLHKRVGTRRREEGGQPGAGRTQPLRQGSLRNEFDFDAPGEEGIDQCAVQPDVARDDTANTPLLEQGQQLPVEQGAVVGNELEIRRLRLHERTHEVERRAWHSEPGDRQAGTVGDPSNGCFG